MVEGVKPASPASRRSDSSFRPKGDVFGSFLFLSTLTPLNIKLSKSCENSIFLLTSDEIAATISVMFDIGSALIVIQTIDKVF